jgi:hypothetical protein
MQTVPNELIAIDILLEPDQTSAVGNGTYLL